VFTQLATMPKQFVALLSLALLSLGACRADTPAQHLAGPLHLVQRPTDGACAYMLAAGDTVIPFGRYAMAATERFDKVALVLQRGGWVSIDRQERGSFARSFSTTGPTTPPRACCAS
jgi:hypothetical protein